MLTRLRSHRCLCGCHVHDFTFFMAILYAFGSFLLLAGALVSGIVPIAFLPLVTLAFSVLVIWGNRYFISCFYLPALAFKFLAALLLIFGSFFVIIYGFYILYIYNEDHTEIRAKKGEITTVSMGLLTILFGLGCLLLSGIHAYFVEIFFRDYLFVKNRNAARDNLPLTTHEFTKYFSFSSIKMPTLNAKVKIRRQWTFDSMTEPNDDYYMCFCNMHAHKYMYALTVVGIILSVLTLLCALCAAQFKLTVPPLISLIIFALAYIGNQRAIPVLYLPLMVVQIIFVIALIGCGVFVIGYGSAVIFNSVIAGQKNPRKRAEIWLGIICMCFGALMLIMAMALSYLTQVLYRAFRYLKDVVIGYKGPPAFTPDYAHVY